MPPLMNADAGQASRRTSLPAHVRGPGRAGGNLAVWVAIAALITQLAITQLTLVLAACLLLIGRLSNWRPLWLAWPAIAGLAWIARDGVRPAFLGYAATAG